MLSTQPLTWTATLLITILVPRYLGDQGFGQYAVAVAAAAFVGAFATAGLPNLLTRRTATGPGQAATDATGALALVLVLSVTSAAGALLAWPRLGLPALPRLVLFLALATMVVASVQAILFAVLVGQERHARFAWLNAAAVFLAAIAGVAVLVAGGSLVAFMAVTALTSGGVTILGWHQAGFKLRRAGFSLPLWVTLVRGGLPFLAWNAVLRIRAQVDIILLAVLLSDHAAGWLGAASRVISIPIFIPTIITTPLLPVLSKHADDPAEYQRIVRRSIVVVLLLTVPCSGLIIALAPHIPGILGWGAGFDHSVPLMIILAFQQPLVAIDMVLGTALLGLRRERQWLAVLVVAAVFNPTLNLLLIPACDSWFHNGAIGAALVGVLTEVIMLAGAVTLLPAGLLDRKTVVLCARTFLAGTGLVAEALAVAAMGWPLAAAAGCVAFLTLILLLDIVQPSDFLQVEQSILRFLRRRGLAGSAGLT